MSAFFKSTVAWLCLACTILAVIQLLLATYCCIMMGSEAGVIDRNWNDGVLIHGSQFVIFALPALLFSTAYLIFVKEAWWNLPIRQVTGMFGYFRRK